ncbi:hypothetical protein [Streptomyces altiplanensis]
MRATNARAGPVRTGTVAPCRATVGISEVGEFDRTDVPGIPGPLRSRLAAYGAPGSVRPRNPYDARRALAPGS